MKEAEVKELTPAEDWKRRSDEEIAEINEKSAITYFYSRFLSDSSLWESGRY